MGRKALAPEEKKILFNCKLNRDVFARLKIICFRRSVHEQKKFSEGKFVTDHILGTEIPAMPTKEEIERYVADYPNKRGELLELAALPVPQRNSTSS